MTHGASAAHRVVSIALWLAATAALLDAAVEHQPGSNATVAWSYALASIRGPAAWDTLLDPETGARAFPSCSAGSQPQSPVRVVDAPVAAEYGPFLTAGYGSPGSTASTTNDGRMVRLLPAGSIVTAELDGVTWTLEVAEFHVPGEHAFGGATHDAELHLVHRHDGRWLVVAVPLVASRLSSHATLKTFLQDTPIPSPPGSVTGRPDVAPRTAVGATASIDWRHVIPSRRDYARYSGSWSYPPCTPADVVVLEQPMAISSLQLEALANATAQSGYAPDGNARPIPNVARAPAVRRFVDAVVMQQSTPDHVLLAPDSRMGTAIAALVLGGLCVAAMAGLLAVGNPPSPPRGERRGDTATVGSSLHNAM